MLDTPLNFTKYRPRPVTTLHFIDQTILEEKIDEDGGVWNNEDPQDLSSDLAILNLLPKPLIDTITQYTNGKQQVEIAADLHVTQGAISHRLRALRAKASFIKNLPILYRDPVKLEQKLQSILDEYDKKLFMLYVYNGNFKHTAAVLGLSFSQVRHRLYKILAMLKKQRHNTLATILGRILSDVHKIQYQVKPLENNKNQAHLDAWKARRETRSKYYDAIKKKRYEHDLLT